MEYSKSIRNRMQRLWGQRHEVIRLMEKEKECKDTAIQLSCERSH